MTCSITNNRTELPPIGCRISNACASAFVVSMLASGDLGCTQSPAAAPGSRAPVPTAATSRAAAAPVASSSASAAPSASAPATLEPDHVQSQQDCPKGMVFVPAGKFAYKGVAFDESVPERQISQTFDIAPFCIDLREVSRHDLLVRPNCDVKERTQYCHFTSDAMACFSQEQAQFYCERSLPGNPRRLPRPEEWLYAALSTDGRHFPWGNTWFPWGNHPSEGRPDYHATRSGFCDFSRVWDQALREGGFVFNGIDCGLSHSSLDVSPFGVENLGSNVLEWTAPSCTVMGIQHSGYPPPEDPPGTLSLINRRLAVCDTSVHMSRRTNELVGFRCVATKKSKNNATDKN